jgi:fructose 5-dehydrogenase small subunit
MVQRLNQWTWLPSDVVTVEVPRMIRDDCPTVFALDRREILAGGLALVGGLATPTVSSAAEATAWSGESAARFMDLSSLLIPHRLNEGVGRRIGAAMSALNPLLAEQVTELLAIAKKKNARIVEDFFPDLPEGPLKETALAIISAWYLGVVTDAPNAEVFTYAYALMYQPTKDVMTIPSYAISAPNAWSAEAPPLSNMPEF